MASIARSDRVRLVRLLRDASLAVHYAHQQGLVHRDIKPQNLMVAAGDQVTLAPGVDEDQRVSKQGDGAGLLVMDSYTISDLELLEQFEAIAKRRKIKAQRTLLPSGGSDAATIQRKASGYRVMTLVCPTRYIHTVTEMVHLDDLHSTRDLLAGYLREA